MVKKYWSIDDKKSNTRIRLSQLVPFVITFEAFVVILYSLTAKVTKESTKESQRFKYPDYK